MESVKKITAMRKSPPSWKIFVVFFFILPFIHYFTQAYVQNKSPLSCADILMDLHPVMIFIIFMPFFIGSSFYLMKRWAWILLTEYSAILIGFQLYMTYNHEDINNIAELLVFIGLFIPILFINRENIIIAYKNDFMSIPRGWRNARRYRLQLPVEIYDNMYFSEDISSSGISISHPLERISLEDQIQLKVHFTDISFTLSGRLVRRSESSCGFSFTDFQGEDLKSMKKHINRERKIQYRASRKKQS